LKISLHESGEWVTQFTTQSGIKIDGASRRVMRWQRPAAFAEGWVQGPSVVVPAVEWAGELNLRQKGKNSDKVDHQVVADNGSFASLCEADMY